MSSETSKDYLFQIARGKITGASSINKFGRNSACAASGDEHIWDGSFDYVFPTTAAITHIRAGTDSAITQGVVIEVQGLDTNFDLVIQLATTDGTNSTTEVELTTALKRVFRMKVLDDTVLDQAIWAGDSDMSGATDTEAIIQIGKGQTQMAIYTIAAGHTAYLTNYYAHHNPTSGQTFTSNLIELWTADAGNGYARQLKHGVGVPEDAGFQHPFTPYMRIPEKHDVFLTSSPIGAAADISAGFDLVLLKNDMVG